MKPIKVHVLFEHGLDERPFGCSHIRLLRPLSHPLNADSIALSYGTTLADADVVIIERLWRPGIALEDADRLLDEIRHSGARTVYSMDDNLLGIRELEVEKKLIIRLFAREANAVLVTTEPLKERMGAFTDNVVVIENALDERLFRASEDRLLAGDGKKESIVIGYMGTFTHDDDFMMILQALRSALSRFDKQVEFQLVGAVTGPSVSDLLQGLPFKLIGVPARSVEYPRFVKWMIRNIRWDIAVAPLVDNELNAAKSDLKFLDYSALSIPGVYSDVSAYGGTVRSLQTGMLVSNDASSWYSGLERLVAEPTLRSAIANEARNYVFSSRTLEHTAGQWKQLMQGLA